MQSGRPWCVQILDCSCGHLLCGHLFFLAVILSNTVSERASPLSTHEWSEDVSLLAWHRTDASADLFFFGPAFSGKEKTTWPQSSAVQSLVLLQNISLWLIFFLEKSGFFAALLDNQPFGLWWPVIRLCIGNWEEERWCFFFLAMVCNRIAEEWVWSSHLAMKSCPHWRETMKSYSVVMEQQPNPSQRRCTRTTSSALVMPQSCRWIQFRTFFGILKPSSTTEPLLKFISMRQRGTLQ